MPKEGKIKLLSWQTLQISICLGSWSILAGREWLGHMAGPYQRSLIRDVAGNGQALGGDGREAGLQGTEESLCRKHYPTTGFFLSRCSQPGPRVVIFSGLSFFNIVTGNGKVQRHQNNVQVSQKTKNWKGLKYLMETRNVNLNVAPNGPPFHPQIVAVLHFSLIQLCPGTLACQEHSVPWEVSHMCARSRSCCSQSPVKITIIVVSLGCKRIISSPLFLNVCRSPFHFNWFSKHRFPCNWSICVSEELDTQFCLLSPGEGKRKCLFRENCWRRGDYGVYLFWVSTHF